MGMRFECPRCQNFFATDAAETDAFAECPKCGALALPAGAATLANQAAFSPHSSQESAAPDITTSSARPALSVGSVSAPSGEDVFDSPKSAGFPASLFPTDEGGALSLSDESLPDFGPAAPLASDEDPMAAFLPAGAGVHVAPSFEQEATRAFDAADLNIDGVDEALELDAGLFDSASLDDAATAAADESGTQEGAATAIPEFAFTDEAPGGPAQIFGDLDDPTMPLARPIAEAGDLEAPAFPAAPVDPQSVTLAELNASLHTHDEIKLSPFSDDNMGDEAFKDLEAAFDEAALLPTDPQQAALAALREDSGHDLVAQVQSNDFVSAPARPAPAAPDLKRRTQRAPHLTLSPEAIALVALPIRAPEVSGKMLAIRGAPAGAEISMPTPAAPAPAEAVEPPSRKGRTEDEARANVASPGTTTKRPFLSGRRLAAAMAMMVLVGLGVGAATAPGKPSKGKARDAAESHFITGNQYYEAARFDDASAEYARAASADPDFAPAHLARGAALVKQGEDKSAIAAYRRYLKLDDDGPEAKRVRSIVAAYDKADARDAAARKAEASTTDDEDMKNTDDEDADGADTADQDTEGQDTAGDNQ